MTGCVQSPAPSRTLAQQGIAAFSRGRSQNTFGGLLLHAFQWDQTHHPGTVFQKSNGQKQQDDLRSIVAPMPQLLKIVAIYVMLVDKNESNIRLVCFSRPVSIRFGAHCRRVCATMAKTVVSVVWFSRWCQFECSGRAQARS